MDSKAVPTPPNRDQAAEGGRRSGESRRRQTARQIAADALEIAITRILTDPPPLTDDMQNRLRTILAPKG